MSLKTQVLIIGGGITGTAIARDLALRGVHSIVIDRSHINAGASGANHGVLHSGARYVASDPESSRECKAENELLKKLAPHCIEDTGGLYVAVAEDDEKYLADFPQLCAKAGVPCDPVDMIPASIHFALPSRTWPAPCSADMILCPIPRSRLLKLATEKLNPCRSGIF
jgi:glycerol-3-phosphate dehydrogenase